MHVVLNGEAHELREGVTVSELVDQLGLGERRIAVEVNHNILARDDYRRRLLLEGDRVEIIHFVGGG